MTDESAVMEEGSAADAPEPEPVVEVGTPAARPETEFALEEGKVYKGWQVSPDEAMRDNQYRVENGRLVEVHEFVVMPLGPDGTLGEPVHLFEKDELAVFARARELFNGSSFGVKQVKVEFADPFMRLHAQAPDMQGQAFADSFRGSVGAEDLEWVQKRQALAGFFTNVLGIPAEAAEDLFKRAEGLFGSAGLDGFGDDDVYAPSSHEPFVLGEGPGMVERRNALLQAHEHVREMRAAQRAKAKIRERKVGLFKDVIAGGLSWLLDKVEGTSGLQRHGVTTPQEVRELFNPDAFPSAAGLGQPVATGPGGVKVPGEGEPF